MKKITLIMIFLFGLTGTVLAGTNEKAIKKAIKSDDMIQAGAIFDGIVVFKGNFPDKVSEDVIAEKWCKKFNSLIWAIQLRQMNGTIVGSVGCQ